MELFYVLILSICSALAYRERGKDKDQTLPILKNKMIRRVLCLLPVAILAVVLSGPFEFISFEHYYFELAASGALVIVAGFFGLITGHGSYFPNNVGNKDNEHFAFITKFISDPLNNIGIFVGMALTGLAITVPIALIPGVSIWFAGVGLLKPVGYFLFYSIRDRSPNWTENAEYWWGYWMVAGLYIASLCYH